MRTVEASIIIHVPPAQVLDAFIEQQHLHAWWGVNRSLVEAKPGGLYLLAWKGGAQGFDYVHTGIIKSYEPGLYLEIASFSYLHPEKQLLGPMELLLECSPHINSTYLHVRQSGYQYGGDWDWFYEVVREHWPKTLQLLKEYLERS